MRSASGYGSDRSRTPLTTLKIAVVAPIPSASVIVVTRTNAGARRNWRLANRISCNQPSSHSRTCVRRIWVTSFESVASTIRQPNPRHGCEAGSRRLEQAVKSGDPVRVSGPRVAQREVMKAPHVEEPLDRVTRLAFGGDRRRFEAFLEAIQAVTPPGAQVILR